MPAKIIHSYDFNGAYVKSYPSLKAAALENNCCTSAISRAAQNKISDYISERVANHFWCYEKSPLLENFRNYQISIYNQQGTLLSTQVNCNQTAKELSSLTGEHISERQVISAINNNANNINGYLVKKGNKSSIPTHSTNKYFYEIYDHTLIDSQPVFVGNTASETAMYLSCSRQQILTKYTDKEIGLLQQKHKFLINGRYLCKRVVNVQHRPLRKKYAGRQVINAPSMNEVLDYFKELGQNIFDDLLAGKVITHCSNKFHLKKFKRPKLYARVCAIKPAFMNLDLLNSWLETEMNINFINKDSLPFFFSHQDTDLVIHEDGKKFFISEVIEKNLEHETEINKQTMNTAYELDCETTLEKFILMTQSKWIYSVIINPIDLITNHASSFCNDELIIHDIKNPSRFE
ncbi:hypothetical protein [Photobacterium leiognathi]|uniref:hypothetical protein n=1 Tax=Photobacterium leiognathi TaxID=553611 RepID=UPI002981B422|nr:hypothetical protein [Photobacterium leiognathi]